MKELTIVVVARNQLEQTKKCLESLHEHTDPSLYKLLFMDNGSLDHTDSWVVWWCKEKGIELKYQYNPNNVGYIGAVNKAYEMCDTKFVLTVHNDVVFCKYWLPWMMSKFTDKKVAAIGPVITFAMGPQSMNLCWQTFGCEPKYLLGLFFLCRKSVLEEVKYKQGEYLSTAYGLGDKEELELCYRIRKNGYKFKIAYDVWIEHTGEKTFIDTLGSQEAFYKYQNEKLQILISRLGKDVVDDIYKIDVKKPIKIVVGVMTRTTQVHHQFMFSMLKLWGGVPVYKYFYHIARGHVTDRNKIIEEALKIDATHVFFVDDDMVFDEKALLWLLAHDVDMCTGLAFQRGEPYSPCIFLANAKKDLYPIECIKQGVIKIDACGTFFLLVKLDAVKKVKKPWFIYGDYSLGYGGDKGIGEDVYFALKAKLAGVDLWCDTDVIIKHIGQEPLIDENTYLDFKSSGKLDGYLGQQKEFQQM